MARHKAAPTELKVRAATVGAGAGVVIADFVLWMIDAQWYHGDASPEVPYPISAFVLLAVTVGLTYASGWYARHTPRTQPVAEAEEVGTP